MTRTSLAARLQKVSPVPTFLLFAALIVLGIQDSTSAPVGLAVGIVAAAISVAWRMWQWPVLRGGLEIAPSAGALIYLILVATPTLIAELAAGFAGVVTLLWLADVHGPGRVARALDQLVLPLGGFAVALAVSILIPPGNLSLGLAALVLVLLIVLLILLLARPSLLGRRESESATS